MTAWAQSYRASPLYREGKEDGARVLSPKDIFTLPRENQALTEQLRYKQKLAEVNDAILANMQPF